MPSPVVAAIDLGASSGRVMAGVVEHGRIRLDEVHRFANGVVTIDGHLRWDMGRLFGEIETGLRRLAERHGAIDSVGIDTWGVDYALLSADGRRLDEPIAYRDSRSTDAVETVHALIDPAELYAINGLQFLPFTTLYQLMSERDGPRWDKAVDLLLIPDLIAHWLTGVRKTERTNASTTGLLDVATGEWSSEIVERLGLRHELLGELDSPGSLRGTIDRICGVGVAAGTPVITVGSHDTASAVAAVPFVSPDDAYIVSGTWSLVGLQLPEPVLADDARHANFTNEGGVGGTTRFLRNVGGLWLLQECVRTWTAAGHEIELDPLLDAAAEEPTPDTLLDVDDPTFIAPDNMPERIVDVVKHKGGRPPETPAQITRVVLESLAAAYAATVDQAAKLTGRTIDRIHVVGGGTQNQLLVDLTAEHTGLEILAGPVEATALGNTIVQARALGHDLNHAGEPH